MLIKLCSRLLYLSFVLGEKSRLARKINGFFQTLMLKRIYNLYVYKGVEGWSKFWKPMFDEFGRFRAKRIKKKMDIDINHAGSIGHYHDYEDPQCGIVGHWEVFNPDYSVRVETECTISKKLEKISGGGNCPQFCREIVLSFENETGKAMNRKYEVEVEGKLLTEGASTCRFIHRLK